jgi:hypothetical protein
MVLGNFVAVHGKTYDVVGLERPQLGLGIPTPRFVETQRGSGAVAVWRSNNIARLGFLTTSSLRQYGSHLGDLIWRCEFGARRSKAPKVRRSGDRG